MDHVYIVLKPKAYPAVTWDGTFENLQAIAAWVKSFDPEKFEASKIEFWEEIRDGERKVGAHLIVNGSHIRLYNGWWLVKEEDLFFSMHQVDLDRNYSIHMTIPKEVPVAAGE